MTFDRKPISAKINQTSPRGTIAVPMINRSLNFSRMSIAPITLPSTDTTRISKTKGISNGEEKSTSLKLTESPTVTKKIGVNT